MTTFRYEGKSLVCVVQYKDVNDCETCLTWFETFDGKKVIDPENAQYPEMYGLAGVDYLNSPVDRGYLHSFADTAILGKNYIVLD